MWGHQQWRALQRATRRQAEAARERARTAFSAVVARGSQPSTLPCINGAPLHGTAFKISPYLGYNWQVAPQWVVGVEGDFGFANRTSSFSGAPFPASVVSTTSADSFAVKTSWDASVRARVGFLVNPSFMLYLAGGPSWLRLELTSTCSTVAPSDCAGSLGRNSMMPLVITQSATPLGWTIGGGGEARLWGNWFARGEYRYADYGTVSATDVRNCPSPCGFATGAAATETTAYSIHVHTHSALFGLAYKFGDPAGASFAADTAAAAPALFTKAPAAVPAPSWTGAYIGLAAGLRSSAADATVTGGSSTSIFGTFPLVICPTCVASESFDDTAFRLAPYAGFNWQVGGQWLVGIEGDWGFAEHKTTLTGMDYPESTFMTGNAADSFAVRTKWDASLRGRVGYLVTPSLLAYITGGAAWMRVESTSTCATSLLGCAPFISLVGGSGFLTPGVITDASTKAGATIGGGLEARLWQNWFARAEYRYADFGTISNTDVRSCAACIGGPASSTVSYDVHLRTHTAMFGVAYQFGDLLGTMH